MRDWMEVALDLIAKTRKPNSPDSIAMHKSWSNMQEDARLGAAIGSLDHMPTYATGALTDEFTA